MKYPLYELKKSPSYYNNLNLHKKPKVAKPPKDSNDTYIAMIEKERNDADMARQALKAREEDDEWVVVLKDMADNKYCGR